MIWETLGGQCIYEIPNHAKVYQNLRYRWLTLNSQAIQTLLNRKYPEKPGLKYAKHLSFAVQRLPAECCLLGLGGAGLAHALSPYLGDAPLLAIEHDKHIIAIAKRYFMTDRISNLIIQEDDAERFVTTTTKKYQHLMIDLFDAHSFPKHCHTESFFLNCQRLLLPEGILALNIANQNEQRPLFDHVRTLFQQRTVSCPVKGTSNVVVLASNSPSIQPLLTLLRSAPSLKCLIWDAEWGYIANL